MKQSHHDLQNIVKAELRPGESIAWIGTPSPWPYAFKQSGKQALWAIPFLVFAIFYFVQEANKKGVDWSNLSQSLNGHLLWVTMFPLIGLGIVLWPLYTYYCAHKIIYFVSNQRACIYEFFRAVNVRSFSKEELKKLTIVRENDGKGDIVFETYKVRGHKGHSETVTIGFLGLMDLRPAEEAINKIIEK